MTGPADEEDARALPAWLREVGTSLSINSQIVLYGNIRDNFLVPGPGGWELLKLEECLWRVLSAEGYPFLLVADVVDGVHVVPEAAAGAADSMVKRAPGGERMGLGALRTILQDVTGAKERRVAAVDYASRLTGHAGRLTDDEHHFFAACERMSHEAMPRTAPGRASLYNPVIWIVNNDRDLPAWLQLWERRHPQDRRAAARLRRPPHRGGAPRRRGSPGTRRPARTSAADLAGPVRRADPGTDRSRACSRSPGWRSGRGPAGRRSRMRSAATGSASYDNPWRKAYLRERLAGAAERDRAHGFAVRTRRSALSVDIMVARCSACPARIAGGSASRPRGVLFFAGPTGVGKTQLAKELTELDLRRRAGLHPLRHERVRRRARRRPARSARRPATSGHDAGGELTNAIRQRPFSLVLFDEIEKAHPRILDKFLQILDDGRLTDGSGSTVYFSEAVLVFTSNLGMSHQRHRRRGRPTRPSDTPSRADLEQTGPRGRPAPLRR